MRISHKVFLNTFIQIAGKIIAAAISFVVTIILARNYGAAGFGDFIKITTYIAFFYLLADFGFNATILKYIDREKKKENYFLQNLLALRFLWSLFLTVVAVLLAVILPFNKNNFYGFSNGVKLGIFILSFTILSQAIFVTVNAIFQKELRYDKSVAAASLGGVVNLIVLMMLVFFHSPLLFVLLSFVIGDIVTVILSLYFVGIFERLKYEAYIDFNLWKRLVRETVPLGLVIIFNLVYFRADMIILSL